MPALEVRGLAKRFGAVEALRGVSFSVAPGEVFGYLGPNGAGKTTTLRVLLGLVRQTAGVAQIDGIAASDPRSRADVGFLPGDVRLYGDMTVAETLEFFARFRPARPPALREMLVEELNLGSGALARRVKFLSHGTRQKVGLIVAMQQDPAVLLLDEPTNGLDPLVQQAFRGVVRSFAARGRAVLFSSHVLSEVEAVSSRVAIVRQGEIVALETIGKLREKVIRKMTVRLRGEAAPLGAIEGVTRSEARGNEITLWIKGEVGPAVAAIAGLPVADLVFPEAQLEDIFMSYYDV